MMDQATCSIIDYKFQRCGEIVVWLTFQQKLSMGQIFPFFLIEKYAKEF